MNKNKNNHGLTFLHCKKCIQEWKDGKAVGESPETYARLTVAYTTMGIQVFCVRHQANVMHVDFQGQRHPAVFNESGSFGD